MIAQEPDLSQNESLVPPKPNLGPEPWPDQPIGPGSVGGWESVVALLLLSIVRWRLRRRRASDDRSRSGSGGASDMSFDSDPTPRQQLIASSEFVRAGLIDAFGPTWGSKTTEEIAREQKLVDRLGSIVAGRLVDFLILADRAKFADDESATLDDWPARAESFVKALESSAMSKAVGK